MINDRCVHVPDYVWTITLISRFFHHSVRLGKDFQAHVVAGQIKGG